MTVRTAALPSAPPSGAAAGTEPGAGNAPAAGAGATRIQKHLPAWPMMLLLVGFPVWWALGAAPFAPLLLAGIMTALMLTRGRIMLVPGVLPWFAFLLWVGVAAINLDSATSAIAYLQRAGNLLAVGVFMVYVINARKTLPARRIILGLLAVWVTLITLGTAAIFFPDVRLTTPVGTLLPNFLTSNPLVYDLVFPPLAEVQQPWGSPEPFNRPAAPFPYANSWGVMFALLTPVVFAAVCLVRHRMVKAVLILGAVLSLWPALETSNRGMFVGLAAAVLYVLARLFFQGRLKSVAAGVLVLGIGTAVLVASGAVQVILDRQLYSDSTGGRLNLYQRTWKATLEQPLLGHATPQMEETVGVSMGTQGYVWMLMFSYGLVGLGLFLYFLVAAAARTWRVASTANLWLHSVPVAALAIIPFYGLDVMQLTSVVLVLALLLRRRYLPDPA
ncbi:O-antigen ligase family protein [Arthrobacter gengyunqii]|uniref:O-antigen ligase family protein n=1 Tax=Arthrobacter gengyunqii TaxID=2886940 RepID=A0ABS8GKA3_9MICC|nr:O-antigen ligase family protein [Arthrobacter gengyunqii]